MDRKAAEFSQSKSQVFPDMVKLRPADGAAASFPPTAVGSAEADISNEAEYYPLDRVSIPNMPLKEKTEWTVLVYMAGDNNLVAPAVENMRKLEMIGSTENTNMAAFFDFGPKQYANKDVYPEGGAKYYLIKKDYAQPTKSLVEKTGAVDSSNPETLSNFLAWGMKNLPAKNYLILFYDHGYGFRGAMLEEPKQSILSMPHIKEAIQKAEKEAGVDKDSVTVGFAACHMAQAEVAYQLKDAAKYLFASQSPTLRGGLPLLKIFGIEDSNIFNDMPEGLIRDLNKYKNTLKNSLDNINPYQLGLKIVGTCRQEAEASTPTISFIDLSKMEVFKDALNNFSKCLLSTQTPKNILKEIIMQSQNFEDPKLTESTSYNMRDIYDIAQKIIDSAKIKDKSLKKQAENLIKSIREVVIAEQHEGDIYQDGLAGSSVGDPLGVIKDETTHGLSIYAPQKKNDFEKWNYRDLDLAKDTLWDEAIDKIMEL